MTDNILMDILIIFALVFGFIMFIGIWASFGGMVSLVVLLPVLRKSGQCSPPVRIMEIFILGLVPFLISFGILTHMSVEEAMGYAEGIPLYPDLEVLSPKIMPELWMRRLVPPTLRQSCYTIELVACQAASQILADSPISEWSLYLQNI